MKSIELIKPGAKVWVKSDNPFQVEVEGLQITTSDLIVTYHIFWWVGMDRKDLWVKADELDVQKDPIMKATFGFSKT